MRTCAAVHLTRSSAARKEDRERDRQRAEEDEAPARLVRVPRGKPGARKLGAEGDDRGPAPGFRERREDAHAAGRPATHRGQPLQLTFLDRTRQLLSGGALLVVRRGWVFGLALLGSPLPERGVVGELLGRIERRAAVGASLGEARVVRLADGAATEWLGIGGFLRSLHAARETLLAGGAQALDLRIDPLGCGARLRRVLGAGGAARLEPEEPEEARHASNRRGQDRPRCGPRPRLRPFALPG